MLGNTPASLGRRLATLVIAAVLLLAGLPFAPAFAAPPFELPGVAAGQADDIRGVYEYDDYDHLNAVPPPPDLAAIQVDSFAKWDELKMGTKEHLYARWKSYVTLQEASDWASWRFFHLARNRSNSAALMAVAEPSVAALAELDDPSEYKAGSVEKMFAEWRKALDRRNSPRWKAPDWERWRAGVVRGQNSRVRGGQEGFERFFKVEYFEREGLLEQGEFRFNEQIPADIKAKLPPDMAKFNRPLDVADFTKTKLIFEEKSGNKLGKEQWKQLADILKIAEVARCEVVYVFGAQPSKATIDRIKKMAAAAGVPMEVRHFRAVPQKKSELAQSGGRRAGPGVLTPPGQFTADTPFTDLVEAAPDSPEEAAEQEAIRESLIETTEDNPEGNRADLEPDLGGVDFTNLELRYVSDTYHNGPGVQYAFKADSLPEDQQSFGGRRNARLASDSFFVWLALTPDKFWVNLNPDEPNRIIDAQFGRTDAGRVLLEADLAMKKSVARFIHPDSPGGKRYWDALRGKTRCVSMRQWIVPAPAVVREDGNELFILDTPLQVKMETEYYKSKQTGDVSCDAQQDPEITRHNEQVYRTQILPQVQDAVNKAPEYADLRRVYASRVAAEWFRKREITKRTAYAEVINRGDISRWASQDKWTPREVFDRYVHSYRNGEFNITRTTTEGNVIYTHTFIYGGVNFSQVDRRPMDGTRFSREHPALAASAKNALHGENTDGRTVWAGGLTTKRPLTEALRTPAPATSNALFWTLATIPLAGWLVVGFWLVRRRRNGIEATA